MSSVVNETEKIFGLKGEEAFETAAIEVFRFQSKRNPVYKEYLRLLKISPERVESTRQIPFLPIELFKTHEVFSSNVRPDLVFTSSGTTWTDTSRHYVEDPALYIRSFQEGFERFYGQIEGLRILALLPSYLERKGSSLIYMVDDLITKSKHPKSGFFLNEFAELSEILASKEERTLLIGVSFALLDFVESSPLQLTNTIVMETGGMKGRRKELTRNELHEILKKGFGVDDIHSEYGMTELLSQAYSKGNGIFKCPPWMRIKIRDTRDPLSILGPDQTGGINVIDLANIHSCSFIATSDIGTVKSDNSFEVIGRLDYSDLRGCNLLLRAD